MDYNWDLMNGLSLSRRIFWLWNLSCVPIHEMKSPTLSDEADNQARRRDNNQINIPTHNTRTQKSAELISSCNFSLSNFRCLWFFFSLIWICLLLFWLLCRYRNMLCHTCTHTRTHTLTPSSLCHVWCDYVATIHLTIHRWNRSVLSVSFIFEFSSKA